MTFALCLLNLSAAVWNAYSALTVPSPAMAAVSAVMAVFSTFFAFWVVTQ